MNNWKDVLNIKVATYNSFSGSQLKGFLKDSVKRVRPHFLFEGSIEITVVNESLQSNSDQSLSLLVYSALNPEIVGLGPSFESVLAASDTPIEFNPSPKSFFKGTNLVLPKNSALDSKFISFEEWTSVNEVKHIALWLLAAFRGIYGKDLHSSLEVEIPLPGEDRPGRLDVLARFPQELLCIEAKTSISDAVKDRRFIEQVPKYKKEIDNSCLELGIPVTFSNIFVVVGGSEEDLRCEAGSLESSAIGEKFLEMCSLHKIKFVTANAIWQCLALKLVNESTSHDILTALRTLADSEDFIGLTSAGFISNEGKIALWSD